MVIEKIINIIAFNGWCSEPQVQGVFNIIRETLNVIRFIVPVALIVMTTIDIMKKVINPDDKDGQKKIMYRAISALIVFLLPTLISIVFWLIDVANGTSGSQAAASSGISACWHP